MLQVLGAFIICCVTWSDFLPYCKVSKMKFERIHILTFSCFFYRGLLLSFSAFQFYYQLKMLPTYSASSISWIGTIQSFLLMATGIFTGPVFDLGYHRTLLFLGGFLTVFGFMMTSLATEYYQIFLSHGICTGLGSGMVHVPNYALVAASFTTRRAVALALVGSGVGIGACLCFLFISFLGGPPTSWL